MDKIWDENPWKPRSLAVVAGINIWPRRTDKSPMQKIN